MRRTGFGANFRCRTPGSDFKGGACPDGDGCDPAARFTGLVQQVAFRSGCRAGGADEHADGLRFVRRRAVAGGGERRGGDRPRSSLRRGLIARLVLVAGFAALPDLLLERAQRSSAVRRKARASVALFCSKVSVYSRTKRCCSSKIGAGFARRNSSCAARRLVRVTPSTRPAMPCCRSRRPPSAALGRAIKQRMFSVVPWAASATLLDSLDPLRRVLHEPALGLFGHGLRTPARGVVRTFGIAARRVGNGLDAPALRVGDHFGALPQRVARGAAALPDGLGALAHRALGGARVVLRRLADGLLGLLRLIGLGHLGSPPTEGCARSRNAPATLIQRRDYFRNA